jgi:hypothetical protein
LVDVTVFEFGEAADEFETALGATEDAQHARAVLIGEPIIRVSSAQHPAGVCGPLKQRHLSAYPLTQNVGGSSPGEPVPMMTTHIEGRMVYSTFK